MAGASIEATLELWASSLREVKARMRPLFTQERVAASAGQFLDGLLGEERRKTGWMRAEAAGDPGPWRQQAILGRGYWVADAGTRTPCATSCAITRLRHWRIPMPFSCLMRPVFSSRARRPAVSVGTIQVRLARSPIARSVCSHPMFYGMVMPSSPISWSGGRSICQRAGRMTGIAWRQPMCRKAFALPPSQHWRAR